MEKRVGCIQYILLDNINLLIVSFDFLQVDPSNDNWKVIIGVLGLEKINI